MPRDTDYRRPWKGDQRAGPESPGVQELEKDQGLRTTPEGLAPPEAFLWACLIPARNPRAIMLPYPASSSDAITAVAVPPGVEASSSSSSKADVPARQAAIPSARA